MTDEARTDAERAERKAAQRQAWNDAHPTYYADYQERNREHIRKTNRERERQRAQRERDEKERRRRGIERAKEWAREHPEERQQARERYKQKHPEAHKQAQREYYYRNREAIAERRRARDATDPQKANEARRRAVARARAAGRVSDWSPSPSQRESYRQRENEARRLSRRRARAGLPDRRLHRVLAAERRHNDAPRTRSSLRSAAGRRLLGSVNRTRRRHPSWCTPCSGNQKTGARSARFWPWLTPTSLTTNSNSGRESPRYLGRASAQGSSHSTCTPNRAAAPSK